MDDYYGEWDECRVVIDFVCCLLFAVCCLLWYWDILFLIWFFVYSVLSFLVCFLFLGGFLLY